MSSPQEKHLDRRECPESPVNAEQDTPQDLENPENHGLVDHFTQDVRTSVFAEIQLLLLTFCTGIQDATTFPDYHCFASNQTGNTVFLCLALIIPSFDGDMFYTGNIGMSLGLFLGAGWLTGQLSHVIGPRKRWWLILCNFVQSCLVLAAAAVQWRYGVEEAHGPKAIAVIGLLAFASGSQVVQSRSLSATEISTAMATAAWVDLMIDQNLLVLKNRPRTRRVMFIIALVAGTMIGALLYRRVGSAAAIGVSAGGKFLVTLMYVFVGAVKQKKTASSV
ncbi:hypothetical protein PT974_08977 [Cladobotryum mycophilum]|uniref:DUF1275 domain protein n=1 Tax=Cladobotryum mycophilum TaxID=491253 RepID=A0ABR0SEY2_9HYPO